MSLEDLKRYLLYTQKILKYQRDHQNDLTTENEVAKSTFCQVDTKKSYLLSKMVAMPLAQGANCTFSDDNEVLGIFNADLLRNVDFCEEGDLRGRGTS